MPDYTDHIDAYLLGKLSEADRQAFEEVLQSDPEIARELEFRNEMKAALTEVEGEEVRSRIQAIAAGKPRQNTSWYWLAAASVVLLLGIGGWFWSAGNPPTGQDLFAAYYHPVVQLDQSRDPATGPSLVDTLEVRYAARDFAFLQQRLDRLPDSAKNRNLQMLEAVTLIELAKDKTAAQLLSSLMRASAPTYADEAAWLKALLHVRNGEFALATGILEPLAAVEGGLHGADAQKLLREIGGRK